MNKRRVVVTGMGAITPLGNDVSCFWENLVAGKSAGGTITRFDPKDIPCKIACEVKGFEPSLYMTPREVSKNDLFVQYAAAAAKMATDDAEINFSKLDTTRAGVIVGSGIGGIGTFETQEKRFLERGAHRVSPFFITMMIADMASGYLAIRYGLKGPNYSTTSACASGAHAILDSVLLIRSGMADVMLTGGTEAPIVPISLAGFSANRAVSFKNDEPESASRPFDATRDGFVMGEGAGILVLEEMEHALNRGAKIHAEIVGVGASADAYHITAPPENGEGAALAMQNTLKDAEIPPEEIQFINAHATSTPTGDIAEVNAVKTVFGKQAYDIFVTANKSEMGHLLGAAGAVEAIATIMSLKTGIIPPTINIKQPDPKCDLNFVPDKAIKTELAYAVSNSFGFGGHNISLVFKKMQ